MRGRSEVSIAVHIIILSLFVLVLFHSVQAVVDEKENGSKARTQYLLSHLTDIYGDFNTKRMYFSVGMIQIR